MSDKSFTGQLMLEWFEANREALKSRGVVIVQILSDPKAWWIEPSAFIELETPFFLGTIETTIDGRCWYHFLPKDDLNIEILERFLCLDPAALEYRKTDWYNGDMTDVTYEPIYEIHEVSDYDHILEPIISRLSQPTLQGESDANV
jgi:hypothetical protein